MAGRWNFIRILFSIIFMIAFGSARIQVPTEHVAQTGEKIAITCDVANAGSENTERPQWSRSVGGRRESVPTSGRIYARSIAQTSTMLMIVNAEMGDAGEYVCTHGSEETTVTVIIYRLVKITNTEAEQHPTQGTDATIVCHADGDPKPEIDWGDTQIGDRISIDSDGNLVIKTFDTATDNGIYECYAYQRKYGKHDSMRINVTGYIPPSDVDIVLTDEDKWTKGIHEDATARLTCTAHGVPVPMLKWYKNNAELAVDEKYEQPSNGILEITKFSQLDVGTYECHATNAVGRAEKDTELNIYPKPKISKFNAEPYVILGNDYSIDCAYDGPDATAIWTKKDERIAEKSINELGDGNDDQKINEVYTIVGDNSVKLVVKASTLDDAAEYVCAATNAAGTVRQILNLEVRKAPLITKYSVGKIRAAVGVQATMSCEAEGIPEPEWTWSKKDGSEIKEESGHYEFTKQGKESIFKITPMNDNDFGTFTCKADNKVEPPATQEIEIMKIEKPLHPNPRCDYATPTSITLKIDEFSASTEENRHPTKIVVTITHSPDEQLEIPTSTLEFAQSGVYKITKLVPSTSYNFNVDGENEAGSVSATTSIECRTQDPTPPGKPMFAQFDPYECKEAGCPLEWTVDETGGKEITSYVVEYRQKHDDGGSEYPWIEKSTTETRFLFDDLRSATKYDVKVKAINEIGTGELATIELHAADEFTQVGGHSPNYGTTGPNTGAIAGIVIIIVLIIVVLVDIACYYVNQCGILMTICVNCCGKPKPDAKLEKEVMMEEGAEKETKFEERQEKQPLKEVVEEKITITEKVDESTPMIEITTKVKETKIDTAV